MTKKQIIKKTEVFVKKQLAGDFTGHDWWHIQHVRRMARLIARKEKADLFVVDLAVLLHDIADWKFTGGDDKAGPKAARAWLKRLGADKKMADKVAQIVERIAFKGGTQKKTVDTIEGKVVQDADRLDALGAIGIARAFAVGAWMKRPIHDPALKPKFFRNFAQYKKYRGSTTINHFYEKLLLLKNRMNTKAGFKIALQRHKFIEQYLKEFYKEWNGAG